MTADPGRREADLVSALGAVRARISRAAQGVGRDPAQITLIAVTKTRPAADVATLARLGVLEIGESKDQEARAKLTELAQTDSGNTPELHWHMLGQLQSNKARSVAGWAGTVHSLDRPKLVRALGDAVAALGREPMQVFVQVSLDDDPERGGVPAAGLDDLADAVAERPELVLRGLMAVPPIGTDAGEQFARLAELSARLQERHPGADAVSAGMSGDLEAAVEHGATHVRVGSALLGRRGEVFS